MIAAVKSGSGKTTLARMITRLTEATSGQIFLEEENITRAKGHNLRNIYQKMQMVFQMPMESFDPRRTLGDGIGESLRNMGISRRETRERVKNLLEKCGLEKEFADRYPHQVSGGQCQRAAIARALAVDPEILICDEATSALDPQTTEEVLDLLLAINKKLHLTIVLITHEMNVIRKICNKVAVMERGKVVEEGDVLTVFKNPKQEVTKRFVQQDIEPEADSKELLAELIKENPKGRLVTLVFNEKNANEPVISQAIRQYNVDINVVYGKIKQTAEGSFGSLTTLMTGSENELDQAERFIKEQGVGVEVIHRG